MRNIIIITFFSIWSLTAAAQDFTGQWKGTFMDKSEAFMGWGGETCEYVLELECKGTTVTGFSYTYFNDMGKRYYTICRLTGKLNKGQKYVEVMEVERTKTNVPNNVRNCFQTHRLTFFKQGNKEILSGDWIPAPNQEGNCGFGTTSLSRRVMQQQFPSYNKVAATPQTKSKPIAGLPDLRDKNKTTPNNKPPVVKVQPQPKPQPQPQPKPTPPPPVVKKDPVKPAVTEQPKPVFTPPVIKKDPAPVVNAAIEKRNNSLLKTIEVENPTINIALYDNGDIDGDSITLIHNGKVLLTHKRLSDKPITITLDATDNSGMNELVMYAENLGSIPPNTALMIVTDGNNRYEVRITSDTQKNGTIRFIHKPGTQ